jgi:hypothetical protein
MYLLLGHFTKTDNELPQYTVTGMNNTVFFWRSADSTNEIAMADVPY